MNLKNQHVHTSREAPIFFDGTLQHVQRNVTRDQNDMTRLHD